MAFYEVGVASNIPASTKKPSAAVALSCPGGNEECLGGKVLYANKTAVHGIVAMSASRLINLVLWASRTINRIVGEGGKGATLELIKVGGEVLVAWTSPGLPEGFRRATDRAEIRRLLRVRSQAPVEDRTTLERASDGIK